MIFKNKQLWVLLMMSVLFYSQYSFAQTSNPLTAVDTFFEGFHKRDSVMIQSVVPADAQLFRTGNTKDGAPFRKVMTMERFNRSVTSRPEKPIWKEQQGKPILHQDQNLAVVWMPFRFYLDQKLRHCGYNLFTLFWNGDTWLITEVSDTGTTDCTVDDSYFNSID